MSEYKKIHGRGATPRYMKRDVASGRWQMVALSSLPLPVQRTLEGLELGGIYSDTSTPTDVFGTPAPMRFCIVCGEIGTRRKYVYAQMVYLCEEDYQNKTTGEIGAKVKELEHAEG